MSSLTINCIGFDWASVQHGGLVVDVGCGLGHVSLEIAKVRPDLHIVLEDRSTVINEAKNVCSSTSSLYQISLFFTQITVLSIVLECEPSKSR